MSEELDPEVVADLQLRARTERERGGKSREPTWSAPLFVDEWLCRGCKKTKVPVTDEAIDAFAKWNNILEKYGDRDGVRTKLRPHEIAFCETCKVRGRSLAAGANREHVDRMKPVIQVVKNSKNPEGEHLAIKQLRDWGHPDVDGLVACVRERLESEKRKGKAKGGL